MAINKRLDQITYDDLQALVDNRVIEDQTTEYKGLLESYLPDLPNNVRDQKKDEFRRDVTSMANAMGGDLIIGIQEERQVPSRVVGVAVDSEERYKQHIQHIIQSRITPNLPPVP